MTRRNTFAAVLLITGIFFLFSQESKELNQLLFSVHLVGAMVLLGGAPRKKEHRE